MARNSSHPIIKAEVKNIVVYIKNNLPFCTEFIKFCSGVTAVAIQN